MVCLGPNFFLFIFFLKNPGNNDSAFNEIPALLKAIFGPLGVLCPVISHLWKNVRWTDEWQKKVRQVRSKRGIDSFFSREIAQVTSVSLWELASSGIRKGGSDEGHNEREWSKKFLVPLCDIPIFVEIKAQSCSTWKSFVLLIPIILLKYQFV